LRASSILILMLFFFQFLIVKCNSVKNLVIYIYWQQYFSIAIFTFLWEIPSTNTLWSQAQTYAMPQLTWTYTRQNSVGIRYLKTFLAEFLDNLSENLKLDQFFRIIRDHNWSFLTSKVGFYYGKRWYFHFQKVWVRQVSVLLNLTKCKFFN
jgi:hypothetical protein